MVSQNYFYIVFSFIAAAIATLGGMMDSPLFYAVLPGLIGGSMAGHAGYYFIRYKQNLTGLISTLCGFVFYQAFQLNPATLPDFSSQLEIIKDTDRNLAFFLGNATTGFLLISSEICGVFFKQLLTSISGGAFPLERHVVDRKIYTAFCALFIIVALPHVLFGRVVMGAWNSILYQRGTWDEAAGLGGFDNWAGSIGSALINTTYWAISLFFIWVYLLRSRYRKLMWALAPFVLLWTAGVALGGARTFIVLLGIFVFVYLAGDPRYRFKVLVHSLWAVPLMYLLLQSASLFRSEGLKSFNMKDLTEQLFKVRGNESMSNLMDGLEYYRTQLVAGDAEPNPGIGLIRGMVERPIEGILMPVPRAFFPWKPFDETAAHFSLFYQIDRTGATSLTEASMGASPGLYGREFIRYGLLGPLTLMFWLGLILAMSDQLYRFPMSDFHRCYAAVLVSFVTVQMRDYVPMWCLPVMPAFLIMFWASRSNVRLQPMVRKRGNVRRLPAQ